MPQLLTYFSSVQRPALLALDFAAVTPVEPQVSLIGPSVLAVRVAQVVRTVGGTVALATADTAASLESCVAIASIVVEDETLCAWGEKRHRNRPARGFFQSTALRVGSFPPIPCVGC